MILQTLPLQPNLSLGPLLLIFLAALVFSVAFVPVVQKVARRFGVLDAPSSRKIHANPVPLLGGAAIYLAVILALVAFGSVGYVQQSASILIGATLMSMLGVWDDKWGLRPIIKLVGQVIAASLLYFTGVQIQFLHNDALNYLTTVLWVVMITNALNLMDNMDGLAGGVAAVASVFFFLIATLTNQNLIAPLSAVLLGGCIGFLYYNFKPGAIFMGDTGSLLLGFILAAVGIKLRFPGQHSWGPCDMDGAATGAGGALVRHHAGNAVEDTARHTNQQGRQGPFFAPPGCARVHEARSRVDPVPCPGGVGGGSTCRDAGRYSCGLRDGLRRTGVRDRHRLQA